MVEKLRTYSPAQVEYVMYQCKACDQYFAYPMIYDSMMGDYVPLADVPCVCPLCGSKNCDEA